MRHKGQSYIQDTVHSSGRGHIQDKGLNQTNVNYGHHYASWLETNGLKTTDHNSAPKNIQSSYHSRA